MYECRIEKDSITQYGERLTTFVGTFPRIVLAELNTHRMLSRSSASSRAIPVETQIRRLKEDNFYPVHWGKNQKGMQADQELSEGEVIAAQKIWHRASRVAIDFAQELLEAGVHKQITNRLLEPFMWHTAIISATEWSNFFHLRDHKDAQPEIQKIAGMMSELYRGNRPTLMTEGWHEPFVVDGEDFREGPNDEGDMVVYSSPMVSAGRCARVSYLNQDGVRSLVDDEGLATRIHKSGHMAPFEHVARPMTSAERSLFSAQVYMAAPTTGTDLGPVPGWIRAGHKYFLGNFNGWVQLRKTMHGEHDALAFKR